MTTQVGEDFVTTGNTVDRPQTLSTLSVTGIIAPFNREVMMNVEAEIARLIAGNILDAHDIDRWRELIAAYKAYDDGRQGEGLPVDVPAYRLRQVATPILQNLLDRAALLAWKMVDDGILNAEKYMPVLMLGSMHIDAAYAGEGNSVERWRMRLLTRQFKWRLSDATSAEMAGDAHNSGNDELPPK